MSSSDRSTGAPSTGGSDLVERLQAVGTDAVPNRLSDAGCIRRAPDPADRRRDVITLTPAGRRRLERLDALITDAQQELLAPLTPEQR